MRPGSRVRVEGYVNSVDPTLRYAFTRPVFRHDKCGSEFRWPLQGEVQDPLSPDRPNICPVCGESGKFTLVAEKSEGFPYATLELALSEEVEEGPLPIPKQIQVVVPSGLKLPAPETFVTVEGEVRLRRDGRLYIIAEKIDFKY